jgi:hypothetical protein
MTEKLDAKFYGLSYDDTIGTGFCTSCVPRGDRINICVRGTNCLRRIKASAASSATDPRLFGDT